jgi:hypothetical protein
MKFRNDELREIAEDLFELASDLKFDPDHEWARTTLKVAGNYLLEQAGEDPNPHQDTLRALRRAH